MKIFKAGILSSHKTFLSFTPELINRDWAVDDIDIIRALGEAERAIGKLDSFSNYIPNIDLYISLHSTVEATQSTKIEGTQTNIDEVLREREDIPEIKRDDWDEVNNYIKSLDLAIDKIKERPFSTRLIKLIHKQLMDGVRGMHKLPGEFRTSQNWIGGSSINNATFIPPSSILVAELMSDLEMFAHNDKIRLPELIKIAIIHYQFETIHPFLDGNGRAGRLIIPVYMVWKGLLKVPVLYISDFFERNRALYYESLTSARANNDIKQWVKFFLIGIKETAIKGASTFDLILKLQKNVDDKVSAMRGRSKDANIILNHLYKHPFINAHQVKEYIGKSHVTAYSLIKLLEDSKILSEVPASRRGKTYVFKDYLDIFRNSIK